jgi:hypothetical protein
MRGGALPPALLLAALGLALAAAPKRVWMWSVLALAATLAVVLLMPVPGAWADMAFLGCWVSTAATAGCVHLRKDVSLRGGIALSLNAGVWAGAVLAAAGGRFDVLKAMPAALLVLPAAWLVARRASIAVKVASSWLIAIALLCAALPFLPVTPGYLPDHLD